LVSGKQVTLSTPVIDTYKRLIADVYIDDGQSVNLLLIKSGWSAYDTSQSAEKELEKEAVLRLVVLKGECILTCVSKLLI
ncbi:thermonuclease family protein, partial [Candidatus Microgenomates bacterium]|nr:thermonuclease family protein [Candidatus Microgenomates bacterium]